MKLSVIIVNYKVKHHLGQCLDSVFRALDGIDGDVFVVDNNSQDGSVEYLRSRFPQVHYIENPANTGFASANNMALRLIRSEYVLLLNPDTIISEDTLARCVSTLDADPTIGACGVRMLNQNGTFALESRRGIPTPTTAFFHMTGLGRLFPKNKTIGRYHMMYLDQYQASPIEIISGAYMFIRRSLLDQVGLLDEDFFMYGEDIDLSYRLLQTGHRNYYIPTRILHYKGESTRKDTYRYVKIFYEAMYIFFRKHYGHYSWALSVPVGCAICVKGAAEYLRRQTRRIFLRHQPDSECLPRYRFALIVGDDHKEKVSQLCDANSLNYTFLTLSDIRSGAGSNYDFLVFDTAAHTYTAILQQMDTLPTGSHRPNIATYSPKENTIIAGSSIIKS